MKKRLVMASCSALAALAFAGCGQIPNLCPGVPGQPAQPGPLYTVQPLQPLTVYKPQ